MIQNKMGLDKGFQLWEGWKHVDIFHPAKFSIEFIVHLGNIA